MPYTVHTLDGHYLTYTGDTLPIIQENGALHIHDSETAQAGYKWPLAAYPAGQWTRYIPTRNSTRNDDADKTTHSDAHNEDERTTKARHEWIKAFTNHTRQDSMRQDSNA